MSKPEDRVLRIQKGALSGGRQHIIVVEFTKTKVRTRVGIQWTLCRGEERKPTKAEYAKYKDAIEKLRTDQRYRDHVVFYPTLDLNHKCLRPDASAYYGR